MSRRSRMAAEMWHSMSTKTRNREKSRRMRQIRDGRLRGQYIDDEARYHAAGLVAPTDVQLVTTITDEEGA